MAAGFSAADFLRMIGTSGFADSNPCFVPTDFDSGRFDFVIAIVAVDLAGSADFAATIDFAYLFDPRPAHPSVIATADLSADPSF